MSVAALLCRVVGNVYSNIFLSYCPSFIYASCAHVFYVWMRIHGRSLVRRCFFLICGGVASLVCESTGRFAKIQILTFTTHGKWLLCKVKVKLSLYTPWRPLELREVEASTFFRHWAHRWRQGCQPYARAPFYPKEDSWYSFLLEAKSTPGAIVRLEGLGKLKISNLSGTGTGDLPACSIVRQPTTLSRAPNFYVLIWNYKVLPVIPLPLFQETKAILGMFRPRL
jgi:hypothetical protein